MKVWRNKMTIGQQLKKFRLLLGLSQADMAAGIVTASFYYKVERDQNEIVIDRLVEILNAHNISLYDFFEAFDKENLSNLNLEKKVYSYFDNRDLSKLIALKKEVKDRDTLIYLKLKLIIADLKGRVREMPQNSQEELRKICLEEDTNAQKDFWGIAISTPLYNFAEAEEVGKFVNAMPSNFSIIFHKLVVKYYLALFNNDSELANEIIGLINQSGFQHYAKTLPQIKGEKI